MHILKIAFQCACLTDTSCFVTYKMNSYCSKCRKKKKNTENLNPEISSTSNAEQFYYQSVQYALVKNPDLLKTKKQKDY